MRFLSSVVSTLKQWEKGHGLDAVWHKGMLAKEQYGDESKLHWEQSGREYGVGRAVLRRKLGTTVLISAGAGIGRVREKGYVRLFRESDLNSV